MLFVSKCLNKLKSAGDEGFAMIVALLANLILLAFCMLSIWISTQDIRLSYRVTEEKRATTAAESGIHGLISSFDPSNIAGSAVSNVQVDPGNNPNAMYTVTTPTRPTTGPAVVPLAGFSIGGGQQWGQTVYVATVTGTNHASNVDIDVGIGYGPVEITTMSR